MRVDWHHRDKCPSCGWVVWTQTDNSETGRPNLKCQCWCGETVVEKNKTVQGGGAEISEEDFIAELRRRNDEVGNIRSGNGSIEVRQRKWRTRQ